MPKQPGRRPHYVVLMAPAELYAKYGGWSSSLLPDSGTLIVVPRTDGGINAAIVRDLRQALRRHLKVWVVARNAALVSLDDTGLASAIDDDGASGGQFEFNAGICRFQTWRQVRTSRPAAPVELTSANGHGTSSTPDDRTRVPPP